METFKQRLILTLIAHVTTAAVIASIIWIIRFASD